MENLDTNLMHTIKYVWNVEEGQEKRSYSTLITGFPDMLNDFEDKLKNRPGVLSIAGIYISSYDPRIYDTQIIKAFEELVNSIDKGE